MLDRIDIHIDVPAIPAEQLGNPDEMTVSSHTLKQQVIQVREIQLQRQKKTNSELTGKQLEQFARLNAQSQSLLLKSIDKLGLSARAYHRILRLSRTIADLAESADIEMEHVAEAIAYRKLDRQWI